MTILLIISVLVITVLLWTNHNLTSERNFYKNQAIIHMGRNKFGKKLEAERELQRMYWNIKRIKK